MNKTPVLGRQNAPPISAVKKSVVKQNQSILSFFGKSEKAESSPLFFDDGKRPRERSPEQTFQGSDIFLSQEGSRFNEDETPVKRRRMEEDDFGLSLRTPSPEKKPVESGELQVEGFIVVDDAPKKSTPRRRGGFVDDSDSDSDGDDIPFSDEAKKDRSTPGVPEENAVMVDSSEHVRHLRDLEPGHEVHVSTMTETVPLKPPDCAAVRDQTQILQHATSHSENTVPTLNREGTSMYTPGEFGKTTTSTTNSSKRAKSTWSACSCESSKRWKLVLMKTLSPKVVQTA